MQMRCRWGLLLLPTKTDALVRGLLSSHLLLLMRMDKDEELRSDLFLSISLRHSPHPKRKRVYASWSVWRLRGWMSFIARRVLRAFGRRLKWSLLLRDGKGRKGGGIIMFLCCWGRGVILLIGVLEGGKVWEGWWWLFDFRFWILEFCFPPFFLWDRDRQIKKYITRNWRTTNNDIYTTSKGEVKVKKRKRCMVFQNKTGREKGGKKAERNCKCSKQWGGDKEKKIFSP